MHQVVELSSDEEDVPVPMASDPDTKFSAELSFMRLTDMTQLQALIDSAIAKNMQSEETVTQLKFQDSDLKRVAESVKELETKMGELRDDMKRLGDPLAHESHCDGDGDFSFWDPDEERVIVFNPVREIPFTTESGVIRVPAAVDPDEDPDSDSGAESGEEDDVRVVRPAARIAKANLPPIGELTEHRIKSGDLAFIREVPDDPVSYWITVKVGEVIEKDDGQYFVLHNKGEKFIRSGGLIVAAKNQINRFQVKQRVVAHYHYRPGLQDKPHRLMPGFVAELGRDSDEYLIFFDNGKAGYVPHNQCFYNPKSQLESVIAELQSQSDVYAPFYARFLEKYMDNYPEQTKLKPKLKDLIFFLLDKVWTKGFVRGCDRSLIQISLKKTKNQPDCESQWIFRGSWMLRDIFLALFPDEIAFNKKETVKKRTRATHKLSLVPPLKGYNRTKGDKSQRKSTGRNSFSRSRHVVQYTTHKDGSDSDFTDCSSQSSDRSDESRKKTYVKKNSLLFEDRTIFQRKEPASKKIVFPIRAPLFPDSEARVLYEGERTFRPHDCSPECLELTPRQEESAVEQLLGRENPFAIPLMLGWRREVRSHEYVTRTQRECFGDVYYRSPCGRSISSIDQVHTFLTMTRSRIPIDLFAFDHELEVFCPQKDIGCYYYDPDLSRGVESSTIPVVNELEDAPPASFTYRKNFTLDINTKYDNIATKDLFDPENENPFDTEFMSCCSCTDNCNDPMTCECQTLTRDSGRIVYPVHEDNSSGYSYRRLEQIIHAGIYECHARCPCNKLCTNRLVQLPNRNRLQVFKTGEGKGWGIRALHDIPKGTFLCQYVARILTPEQGNDGAHDDTYFADLDHIKQMEANKRYHKEHPEDFIEDDEDSEETIRIKRDMLQGIEWRSIVELFDEGGTYVVDSITEGNMGRFFNHSCEPNCEVQNVFLHTQDPRFPCICIFTTKTVKAMQELTWDYGYEVDSVPGRRMYCRCGARNCRKRLL